MTLAKTLAAPFYHTRKEVIPVPDLIFYYAIEKRFMSKEEAYRILKKGENQGLIEIKGDMVRLLFDINSVEIPIGYKPSSSVFQTMDPFDELLDRICLHTNKKQGTVISEMNQIMLDIFHETILSDAVLVIVAKKYHVPVTDLLDEFRKKWEKK